MMMAGESSDCDPLRDWVGSSNWIESHCTVEETVLSSPESAESLSSNSKLCEKNITQHS